MGLQLFSCTGGSIGLPERALVLVDRQDGGNLIVSPAREVWERSELSAEELTQWSFLVAAAGRAMLDVLPQLAGGCVNYWEAGNWALNEQAEPRGPKYGPLHRRVHLHLLGRSRSASDRAWRWGEAPLWPDYAERHDWAKKNQRLTPEECQNVVARVELLLKERYGVTDGTSGWAACPTCKYPVAGECGESRK